MKSVMKIILGLLIVTSLVTGCSTKERIKKTRGDDKAVEIETGDTEYKYKCLEI